MNGYTSYFPYEFTNSLLSQYRLTASGIGLGTAYSLKYKKGLIPMIAAGATGTTCDLVYGYLIECAQFTKNTNNDNNDNDTPNINSNSKSNEKYFK
jgi:hypothetical protein